MIWYQKLHVLYLKKWYLKFKAGDFVFFMQQIIPIFRTAFKNGRTVSYQFSKKSKTGGQ